MIINIFSTQSKNFENFVRIFHLFLFQHKFCVEFLDDSLLCFYNTFKFKNLENFLL